MESKYLVFGLCLVALYGIAKFFVKRRKDRFLKEINYSTRISKVKSKPANGLRRTKEEILRDEDKYQKLIGDDFRTKAKADQIKAKRIGSPGYIWHADDGCEHCQKNDGKKFKWGSPPKTGHPGEGRLCKNGYCRCWAEVIVPPPSKR